MTKPAFLNSSYFRYIPFAVFMMFIGLDELLRFLAAKGLFTLGETTLYYLYPLKALVVGYLLYRYRHEYGELSFSDLKNLPVTFGVCIAGLLVFVLWIHMDWTFGASGTPQGYNPQLLPEGGIRISMILLRIAGAVLVVPLMEELFWRSFLIRYLVNNSIEKVTVGTFTWGSFAATVILFGLEHHFIAAGIMAGAAYNLVLYRTRSLIQCVLAHAVTNLALAIYVIYTGKWNFW